jgi:glutamine amidotransferase
MISIVDYGSGNLRSIQKSFERFYPEVKITKDIDLIKQSKGIVLPGVGSFGDAIKELTKNNLFDPLNEIVRTVPTIGICLGMQLLFSNSEESIGISGFDIIPGEVIKLKPYENITVPHTGWNRLISNSEPLFHGYAYFNHSYYCNPHNKELVISYVNHGESIPAIVIKDQIIGIQFHPEKSKITGEDVIKYYISLLGGH